MKRLIGMAMAAGLVAAGCGGQPLSVWKVSALKGAKPASCYRAGIVTDTVTVQTTVEEFVGNWELYKGPEDKLLLHIGDDVYPGTGQGEVRTFEGLTTTTEVDHVDNPTRTKVETKAEKITLTMAKDTFTGEWEHTTVLTCTGSACSATFHEDNPDCTIKDSLKGTRIPVENLHEL